MDDATVIKILTDALVSILEHAPPAEPELEWDEHSDFSNVGDAVGLGHRIAHQEFANIARNALQQTGLTPTQ